MNDKQQIFNDVNSDPTPGTDCQAPAGEGRGDYLLRLRNWFGTQYQDWSEKKAAFEQFRDQYNSVNCSDSAYNSKRSECNGILQIIESNSCLHAQGVAFLCGNYDACYNQTVTAYQSARGFEESEVASRKTHWRAVKRIECFLNAVGNGSSQASLEACLSAAAPDTSHLDINYPDVPAMTSCDDPTTYPGTPSYSAAVYGNLPAGFTPPAIVPCTLPTPQPAPPNQPAAP